MSQSVCARPVSPAGLRLLSALASNPHLQLLRTASARRRFYALDLSRPHITRSRPVNQQAAAALERAGLIEQIRQCGQHRRTVAPFIWGLSRTGVTVAAAHCPTDRVSSIEIRLIEHG